MKVCRYRCIGRRYTLSIRFLQDARAHVLINFFHCRVLIVGVWSESEGGFAMVRRQRIECRGRDGLGSFRESRSWAFSLRAVGGRTGFFLL